MPTKKANVSIEECLNTDPLQKGVVSILYETVHIAAFPSTDYIKAQWEAKGGSQISEMSWQLVIGLVHSPSIRTMHELLQFKELHWLHLTSSILAKLFSGVDENCLRCWCDTWAPTAICFGLVSGWRIFEQRFLKLFANVCGPVIDPKPFHVRVVPKDLKITANQAIV